MLGNDHRNRLTTGIDPSSGHGFFADAKVTRESDDVFQAYVFLTHSCADPFWRHQQMRGKAVGFSFNPPPPVSIFGIELVQVCQRTGERMVGMRPMAGDQEMAKFMSDRKPAPLLGATGGKQDGT